MIAQCARKLNKRPSEIAERSDQLIAHIVFQLLDTVDIDEDSFDRETALKNARELTNTALKWFVFHLDDQFGKQSSITPTLGDLKRCELLVKLTLGSIADGSASPNIDVKARKSAGNRRPTTVSMLIDHELLAEGTQLNFIATGAAEREALEPWLDEDPRRGIATWVPERPRCLLWSYDGHRHTPTGLVTKIWELAGWSDAPIAVQGPARWGTGSQTLAAIAEERWREMQSE